MRYGLIKLVILLFIIFLIAFILGFLTMYFLYGCLNPEYQLVKEYSIENYSCPTLKDAIVTFTFLRFRDSNYVCGNNKVSFNITYDQSDIRKEFQRRCLNYNEN